MSLRVASLEPGVTATLCALGLEDHLVAVSRYCSRLADVEGLPQLEVTWNLDAAAVAALEPDLVIASVPFRAGRVDELLKEGLDVLCLYPRVLADVYRHIRWLARLAAVPDRGEATVREMQAGLDAVGRSVQGLARPRIFVEIWPDPLMSAPPWVAELVEIAGGCFVPPGPGRRVEEQEVLAADPQVIVLAWAGVSDQQPERVLRRPGWEAVTAVRTGRVVPVREVILNAPSPRLVEGAWELARAIHGV